ncbi:MAG: hypothetical protein AB1486_32920 [Planctomycetota bacterium]
MDCSNNSGGGSTAYNPDFDPSRCTIVVDRVFVDSELIEETFDWFAQDVDGNVWYWTV